MLLLFSGDTAINSDAAATTIQNAGWDRKSTRTVVNVTLSLTAYFTSSLLTRFSTWFSLVNISRFVSFISVCNVSRLVAICSTALVSLITAAAASSLRREKPNSPIAATLMLAPAIAANTSITAQAGVASILAPGQPLRFGWCALLINLLL
jgi:hypothetical protein